MDITKITDIDRLKSLAYDQMQLLNQSQQNLQVINARIQQVQEEPKVTKK